MKIRTRLSLWYLVVSFAITVLFCTQTYIAVKHLLISQLKKERELVVNTIAGSFSPVTGTHEDLEHTNIDLSVDLEEHYIVIYNSNRIPIYRSPLTERVTLSIPFAQDRPEVITVLRGRSNEAVRVAHKPDIRFNAVSRKLFHDGEHVGWVNVASSMYDIDDALRHLMKSLLIAELLAIVLIAVGAYFLTRRALGPVAAIIAKARAVSLTNLSERLEISNPDDEIGQLSTVLNDSMERLQRAFESQQQFTADAAHELKTPITVLRSHWEDELNNPELPLKFKTKLVDDLETISRLNRVINSLLLLSEHESPESTLEMSELPFDELLKEVVSNTQMLAEIKSQRIAYGKVTPAIVRGDRDRLYRLIFNLLENAIKYTPENGTVAVSLANENDAAVLRVKDNGPGIPKEDIENVFNRFYRVGKDRSRRTGGSGLGLAICKMIAWTHGGTIYAQSTMGEGTVFVVTLPTSKKRALKPAG